MRKELLAEKSTKSPDSSNLESSPSPIPTSDKIPQPQEIVQKPTIKLVTDLKIFDEVLLEIEEKFSGIEKKWKRNESNIVSGLALLEHVSPHF